LFQTDAVDRLLRIRVSDGWSLSLSLTPVSPLFCLVCFFFSLINFVSRTCLPSFRGSSFLSLSLSLSLVGEHTHAAAAFSRTLSRTLSNSRTLELYVCVFEGHIACKCLEVVRNSALRLNLPLGTKVILKDVPVRKGLLILGRPEQIQVLG
jgi:RMI1, N-terminal OB-fold domain